MHCEFRLALAAAIVAATAACGEAAPAQDDRVAVRPADTGAAIENPGMGWVFHFYDNVPAHYGSRLIPSDTLDDFPGLTVRQLLQRHADTR